MMGEGAAMCGDSFRVDLIDSAHVWCTTTPGRGGYGRPSGAPSGLLPEGPLTPGCATRRPAPRWGRTPGIATPASARGARPPRAAPCSAPEGAAIFGKKIGKTEQNSQNAIEKQQKCLQVAVGKQVRGGSWFPLVP